MRTTGLYCIVIWGIIATNSLYWFDGIFIPDVCLTVYNVFYVEVQNCVPVYDASPFYCSGVHCLCSTAGVASRGRDNIRSLV